MQCRANEVKVKELMGGKDVCCCDLKKELPPPTELDPKLVAPKCYYDRDGNVVPFSTLTAGLDLVCKTSDTMLTFTDEKDPASCCLLKDMITVSTTVVPPGTREVLSIVDS